MKGRDVVKVLKNHDWTLDRINGSHHIMIKEGYRPVPVPVHSGRDLPKGLLLALEKQTGVDLKNS